MNDKWVSRPIVIQIVVVSVLALVVLVLAATDVVALTTLGLCVTAGTLAGQVFGTRWAVRAARPPA